MPLHGYPVILVTLVLAALCVVVGTDKTHE